MCYNRLKGGPYMSKVKLADIAKEAGVSIATVSYVLNNKQNQKINEKTKKHILQIASLLGYTKNTYASALANGKSNHIGIYVGQYSFALLNSELLLFLNRLVETLKLNGYETVLLSNNSYAKTIGFVDAILCVALSDEDFKTICKNSIIPVIAVNTKSHEQWIFEISSYYLNIKERYFLDEPYTLITYQYHSDAISSEIKKNNENTIFISNFSQIDALKDKIKTTKVLVSGNELYDYIKSIGISAIKYQIESNPMINKIMDCLKMSIEHSDVDIHVFKF